MTRKTEKGRLQYRTGHKTVKDGKEYVVLPQYDYVTVEKSHVSRYKNCLYTLMGISGCPRNLIDYLVDTMSDGNVVGNNTMTRNGFADACKKAAIPIYSDNTVKQAFQDLVKVGFLLPLHRGFYAVNPQYFFAGEEADRLKMIKVTLEFAAGTTTAFQILKKEK